MIVSITNLMDRFYINNHNKKLKVEIEDLYEKN